MENLAKIQNNTFFEQVYKVHFVGIAGVSMKTLAQITKSMGIDVVGSNIVITKEVEELRALGYRVYVGHSGDNIENDVDLVVYTGAVSDNNPELLKARELKIATVERGKYLGEIAKLYDNVIAVAGSHGKTSTTAMISHIFKVAGYNPTMHLGGESVNMGSCSIGGKKFFITEACEYRNSMADLTPHTAVITNIDDDHLDYYKTKKNLTRAFIRFADNAKDYLIVSSKRKYRQIGRNSTFVSAGLNGNQDAYAYNIKKTKKGFKFSVCYMGLKIGVFSLNILGKHNIRNAIFAIIVAYLYNIKPRIVKRALKTYKGVKRRYEDLGKYMNIPVISDYAHHPTEIKASLNGLKRVYKNMLVVFQPHTFSRTKNCKEGFATAFFKSKALVLYKTYPAREEYDKDNDERTIYNIATTKHKALAYSIIELWDNVDKYILKFNIDAIVVMGAGDMPIEVEENLKSRKK